jgi:hypothetical protein
MKADLPGPGVSPERGKAVPSLVLAGASAGVLGCLLAWGWDYYVQPLSLRPLNPYHDLLRPSGRLGLTLAVLGTGLVVLNLAYLVRREFVRAEWLGSLRGWLALHVWTGVVGGEMIVVHSAFRPYSALGAIADAALVLTLLTGLVGRYLYIRCPRSPDGRELSIDDLQRQLDGLSQRLVKLGLDLDQLRPEGGTGPRESTIGILGNLVAFVTGDCRWRRDYRYIRRQVLASPQLAPAAGEILPLLKVLCRQWQWLERYPQMRRLTASWRFLHLWCAVVMVMVATFHILIAVRFGGLWILGGRP